MLGHIHTTNDEIIMKPYGVEVVFDDVENANNSKSFFVGILELDTKINDLHNIANELSLSYKDCLWLADEIDTYIMQVNNDNVFYTYYDEMDCDEVLFTIGNITYSLELHLLFVPVNINDECKEGGFIAS